MEFYQASTKKTKCGTSQEKRRNTDVSIVKYMDLPIKKIKKRKKKKCSLYRLT